MNTANSNFVIPFSPTDGDASFGGMDWSLPGGDYDALFDLNDPLFSLQQYEFDPSLPPLVVDPQTLRFPAAETATYVSPSDLHNFQSVSLGAATATPLPATTPYLYTPQPSHTLPPRQPVQSPPALSPSVSSPPAQEAQSHKQRTKKIESGFPCTHPGCSRIFDRNCDLRKHAQRTHTPQEKRAWKCPHPNCNKRFVWPKDVARHRRQVHGEDGGASSMLSPTDLSPATTRTSGGSGRSSRNTLSGTSQSSRTTVSKEDTEKNRSGPPAKRQRQLLAALPGKLTTTLWLCRSVVLLKGLRLRRKSTRSEEDEEIGEDGARAMEEEDEEDGHDGDGDIDDDEADAPGEVVEEVPHPQHHTRPPHLHLPSHRHQSNLQPPQKTEHPIPAGAIPTTPSTTIQIHPAGDAKTSPAPITTSTSVPLPPSQPPKRWLLITPDRKNFRAVEVTGAATADEVMGCVRRATHATAELELAMREFSLRDGTVARAPMGGEALMKAVAARAGDEQGLMLLLTAVRKGSSGSGR